MIMYVVLTYGIWIRQCKKVNASLENTHVDENSMKVFMLMNDLNRLCNVLNKL